jgi:hypothetical protein
VGSTPHGSRGARSPARRHVLVRAQTAFGAGKRAWTRTTVVIAAGTALALAAVGIAGAVPAFDNMTPTANYGNECIKGGETGSGTVCQDNSGWTFYRQSSLETADKNVVWDVLFDQFAPTHLTVTHDTTPNYSGGAETDLIFKESAVPGSNEGITWCNDPLGLYTCDQHYVDLEPGHYTRGLTCHESGHAVGLLHGHNSSPPVSQTDSRLGCMRTPIAGSAGTLGSNQVEHINATSWP